MDDSKLIRTVLSRSLQAQGHVAAVALENYQREERLRREIGILRIEIDEKCQARALAEVTDTDFFRALEAKKDMMRRRHARARERDAGSRQGA